MRYYAPIFPQVGTFYFEVFMESIPETTNTWKVCVGIVPMAFQSSQDRHWVGAQHSWGYIAGTGGKCYNSGKSLSYGDPYGEGDVVGVLVNFDEATV